jgi:hypothetical protein
MLPHSQLLPLSHRAYARPAIKKKPAKASSNPPQQQHVTPSDLTSEVAQHVLQEQYRDAKPLPQPFPDTPYNPDYENIVTVVGILKSDPEMKDIEVSLLLPKMSFPSLCIRMALEAQVPAFKVIMSIKRKEWVLAVKEVLFQ